MPENLRRNPAFPRQGTGQAVHRGSAPGFVAIQQVLQRILQLDPHRSGSFFLKTVHLFAAGK
jgi:hypothetical protein